MKLKYDRIADAAYVTVRPGRVASTERIDALRLVDYDQAGRVLRIEFLDFRRSGADLSGLPYAEQIESLLFPQAGTKAARRGRPKVLAE
jgi:uncharacterized protein YuzE